MPSLLLSILLLSLSIEACRGRSMSFDVNDSAAASRELSKDAGIKEKHPGMSIQRLKEVKRGATSGAVPILSPAKVSWGSARKDRSRHPGFHVDYIGPRTHPPAHN